MYYLYEDCSQPSIHKAHINNIVRVAASTLDSNCVSSPFIGAEFV